MRMRRKKHREDRMESCSELMIKNISALNNDLGNAFDNDNPIRLEIGCGKGKFIFEMAQNNPDINFVAVERCLDVLVLAMEKVKNANLKNVKFIPGNVSEFSAFETKTKCDVIYLNFCDPWKKNRYAKRRLTYKTFLDIYKGFLNPGGALHFKTDNRMLFEFSLNSFCDYGLKLKNITLDLANSGFEGNVMTEYETNFTELGQPIYRCEAIFE